MNSSTLKYTDHICIHQSFSCDLLSMSRQEALILSPESHYLMNDVSKQMEI